MGIYVQTVNRPSQRGLFTKFTFVYTFQQIKSYRYVFCNIYTQRSEAELEVQSHERQDLCINSFQAVKIKRPF